jgi:hypothetical protein
MTSENVSSFRKIIEARLLEPIGEFEACFTKYMGIGHHLYVFVNDFNENEIHEVCDRKIHPKMMIQKLKTGKCKMIVVDVEMGGIWEINNF